MADTWLTRFLNGNFSDKERELIHLTAKVAELEALNSLLERENCSLREQLRELQQDDRETRRGLFVRLGVLPSPQANGEEKRELKPIRKVTVPWHQQAAKLEADSRERYWKKKIEEAEKPPEQRKAEAEAKNEPKTEAHELSDQIQADIEELSK